MDLKKIWEDFFSTWKSVITKPEEFFAQWDKDVGWEKMFTFVGICGLLAGAVLTVLTLFSGIATIIIFPIFLAVGTLIGGMILFVCFKLFGGTGDLEPTIKMVGYTQAVSVVSMGVPIIGIFFGLYQFWLLVVGGKAVHKLDTGKAAIAVLLPAVVVSLLGLILAMLGVGILGMMMGR